MVSQKEIIEVLRMPPNTHFFELMRIELINRIESEGIAPPDGWVLVRDKYSEAYGWMPVDESTAVNESAPKGVSE